MTDTILQSGLYVSVFIHADSGNVKSFCLVVDHLTVANLSLSCLKPLGSESALAKDTPPANTTTAAIHKLVFRIGPSPLSQYAGY